MRITHNGLNSIFGIALFTILGICNQNSDAGTPMQQIELKKIQSTHNASVVAGLDHQTLLTSLLQVKLLLFEKTLQLMT